MQHLSIPRSRSHARSVSLVAIVIVGASGAQGVVVTREYGIDFVTVGAPGNRNTIPSEVPFNPELSIGAVAYEYRIARTEISAIQWLDFVTAYAPHWQGNPNASELTSIWINHVGGGNYQIHPGAEQWPIEVSWHMTARYANWLHNDQRLDKAAFETGAYDTSTFGFDPQGHRTDQRQHSPGARFWIPTDDEWAKAVYYDPNRHGPGQEGYWQHPNGSDEPLITGPFGQPYAPGAQTNAGMGGRPSFYGLPVGAYPDVASPWGVLDASGGVREWLETYPGLAAGFSPSNRHWSGSYQGDSFYPFHDRLDEGPSTGSPAFLFGIRLAAAIPAPSVHMVLIALGVGSARRNRRTEP